MLTHHLGIFKSFSSFLCHFARFSTSCAFQRKMLCKTGTIVKRVVVIYMAIAYLISYLFLFSYSITRTCFNFRTISSFGPRPTRFVCSYLEPLDNPTDLNLRTISIFGLDQKDLSIVAKNHLIILTSTIHRCAPYAAFTLPIFSWRDTWRL